MKASKNDYKLIDRKNEGIWNFYINNNSIYYKIINQGICEEETKLIDNIKNYDINIDSESNIHLICVTYNGEFYYFVYSKDEWKKTVIEEYDPELNSIDYLDLIIIDRTIHVFYSFRNIINKDLANVVHYIYNDKWNVNYLEKISLLDNETKPYFVDYHPNGDIYLLFKEEKEVYLRIFDLSSGIWRESKKIECSTDDIDLISFFIDKNYNISLIYKNDIGTIHAVNNSGDISNKDKWSANILVEEIEEIHSSMFELDTKLYIIWRNKEFLYFKCSNDCGINWIKDRKFKYDNMSNIHYIGTEYKDTKLLKYINTFGNIKDNEISLVGIDDNILFCTEIVEEHIEEKESFRFDENDLYDEEIVDEIKNGEEFIREDVERDIEEKESFEIDENNSYDEEVVSESNNREECIQEDLEREIKEKESFEIDENNSCNEEVVDESNNREECIQEDLEREIEEKESFEIDENNSCNEEVVDESNDKEECIQEDLDKIIDDINSLRSNIEEKVVSQKNNETFLQRIGKYFNKKKEG